MLFLVIERFRDGDPNGRAWMAQWSDLVDFEVEHVITSAEAAARVV